MFNPETSLQSKFFMRSIESAAPSLGVEATAMPVRATGDIEPAIESFARLRNAGVILPPDSFTNMHESLIVDLANRHRHRSRTQSESSLSPLSRLGPRACR